MVNVPATGVLKVTSVLPLPPAGTGIDSGDTVNCVDIGAVQVMVAATRPGFWNAIGAVVGAPPTV